jgi:hypothetical protein
MDCYKCIHRRPVYASHHSMCAIPKNVSIYANYNEVHAYVAETVGEQYGIKLNPHGVKNGWAAWPWNFDPIWIVSCNRYTEDRFIFEE